MIMKQHYIGIGLCAAILLSATACGRDSEREVDISPVTVTIVGDSLIRFDERSLGNGLSAVDCTIRFRADVDGPEGEHAVMQGGRLEYFWWQTGGVAAELEWSQREVTQLWVDSILPVGREGLSREQGFGQSAPHQPVRAEVTFEYRTSNTQEVKRTEPFRFYCY
jgi:hypothetical protein